MTAQPMNGPVVVTVTQLSPVPPIRYGWHVEVPWHECEGMLPAQHDGEDHWLVDWGLDHRTRSGAARAGRRAARRVLRGHLSCRQCGGPLNPPGGAP